MEHEQPPEKKEDPAITWLTVGLGTLGTMAVLGLAGLWLLAPRRHHSPGQLTACKSNLKNIGTAYEMYSTDYSGKYPQSIHLLTPNYLKTIPECPRAGSVTYRAGTGLKAPMNSGAYEDYYYVECFGANHKNVGIRGNYPAYNGIEGLVERGP